MAKIFIAGCGFGTAIAVLCQKIGHKVTLWTPFEKERDEILTHGECKRLLPGIKIDKSINVTVEKQAAAKADIIVFAVPSGFMRENARAFAPLIKKNAVAVSVSKGLEDGSYKRLSQVISEEIPNNSVVVLSGPSHAEEVGKGVLTTIVAASEDQKAAEYVQEQFSSSNMRIYTNDDVVGVELGGALKNSIALALGICDGMGLGDNTKAALMTRGLTEMGRLGTKMGARMDTFAGLSGIGDLIVTCTSVHSRNHRCGMLIGKGVDPKEAVSLVGTVEGYSATKNAYELSRKVGIDMPIVEQMHSILFGDVTAYQAMLNLTARPKTSECESVWIDK